MKSIQNLQQIAGLMLYSAHQGIPSADQGMFAGTYNGKPFSQSGAKPYDLNDQQIDFLKNIEARGSSEDKMVLQILKKLTIQAYTNSEYFLTKHRNYTIAPGFYHGCTPINS